MLCQLRYTLDSHTLGSRTFLKYFREVANDIYIFLWRSLIQRWKIVLLYDFVVNNIFPKEDDLFYVLKCFDLFFIKHSFLELKAISKIKYFSFGNDGTVHKSILFVPKESSTNVNVTYDGYGWVTKGDIALLLNFRNFFYDWQFSEHLEVVLKKNYWKYRNIGNVMVTNIRYKFGHIWKDILSSEGKVLWKLKSGEFFYKPLSKKKKRKLLKQRLLQSKKNYYHDKKFSEERMKIRLAELEYKKALGIALPKRRRGRPTKYIPVDNTIIKKKEIEPIIKRPVGRPKKEKIQGQGIVLQVKPVGRPKRVEPMPIVVKNRVGRPTKYPSKAIKQTFKNKEEVEIIEYNKEVDEMIEYKIKTSLKSTGRPLKVKISNPNIYIWQRKKGRQLQNEYYVILAFWLFILNNSLVRKYYKN